MRVSDFLQTRWLAVLVVAACCSSGFPADAQERSGRTESRSCPGDDTGLALSPGFCATVFADGIGHARHLAVAPNGVVYVNTWSGDYYGNDEPPAGGFLVALRDTEGDGKADVVERFGPTARDGAAGGTGIALFQGSIYAEAGDRIVRYSLPTGSIVPTDSPQTIVSGLPLGGDHPMHPFLITPDGALYVDVASASNSCQERNRQRQSPGDDPCRELDTRGGVWRYDAGATNQVFSPKERFATGIRNASSFARDAGGRIFATQHGRDQLYSNWPDLYPPEQEATLPAEELLLLEDGGDYGWPYCYYDPFVGKLVLAPEYGGDGGKTIGRCASKMAPVAAFPAHWAPNGMAHYDGKEFPERYRNGVFIAFHGSWNRAPFEQGGYNVVFQPLSGDRASGQCEIFADGFAGAVKSPGKAAHRPAGLAVGPDGALFVSDDVSGRIYRVVYAGGSEGSLARITPCPGAASPAGPIAETGSAPEVAPEESIPVPEGATLEMVETGDRIYHGRMGRAACTGCHGEGGEGTPLGPALTGGEWIWSDGSLAGIAKTIADGVSEPKRYRSPMPAAGGRQLTADQISALASYVWSLSHREAGKSK